MSSGSEAASARVARRFSRGPAEFSVRTELVVGGSPTNQLSAKTAAVVGAVSLVVAGVGVAAVMVARLPAGLVLTVGSHQYQLAETVQTRPEQRLLELTVPLSSPLVATVETSDLVSMAQSASTIFAVCAPAKPSRSSVEPGNSGLVERGSSWWQIVDGPEGAYPRAGDWLKPPGAVPQKIRLVESLGAAGFLVALGGES